MARNFVAASSHEITMSVGAVSGAGAQTLLALVRATSLPGGDMTCVSLTIATDSGQVGLGVDSAGKINYIPPGSNSVGTTAISAGVWYVIGVSRPAGAAQTVRCHILPLTGNVPTWTHENMTGTQGNPPGGTIANILLGMFATPAVSVWNGDIAIAGVWDSNLTDAQIETLSFTLIGWISLQPKALWILDQSATGQKVRDITGGGANEASISGTAVATGSVPTFSYGHPTLIPDLAEATVLQYSRPDADIVTTGWATAPLWSKINEEAADGTVITATAS